MNLEAPNRLSALTSRWATALTERESVTGSEGEAAFGPWLLAQLRREAGFRQAEIWTIEVGPPDSRHCVAMLLRGTGRSTVLLTGHYDTVTTRDDGALEELATRPEPLTRALSESLAMADTPAERLARDDLAGGAFLAGRGLLDMKAGLAAGLAVCSEFAQGAGQSGNLCLSPYPMKRTIPPAPARLHRCCPQLPQSMISI